MNRTLIVAFLCLGISAAFAGGGHGFAGRPGGGGFGPGGPAGRPGAGAGLAEISRFVSVHVPPPQLENSLRRPRPKIIQNAKPDKHYNIIFIRAPTPPRQPQTEIHIPAQPERKTLVYVLVPKPSDQGPNIKFRHPGPTQPTKPEVYFVQYKDKNANVGIGGAAASNNGVGSVSGGYA